MNIFEILSIAAVIIIILFIVGNLNYHRTKRQHYKNMFSNNDNLNLIIDYVFFLDQVSSRDLEKQFSIGYARAQRILEVFEHLGLVKSRKYPNLGYTVEKTQIKLLFDGYLLINKKVWAFILSEVKKKDAELFGLLEDILPLKIDGATLLLKYPSGSSNSTQIDYASLEDVIEGIIGKKIRVKFIK